MFAGSCGKTISAVLNVDMWIVPLSILYGKYTLLIHCPFAKREDILVQPRFFSMQASGSNYPLIFLLHVFGNQKSNE